MRWVVRRAKEWNVTYYELPPYLFACLTAQQIISLAEEARKLINDLRPHRQRGLPHLGGSGHLHHPH